MKTCLMALAFLVLGGSVDAGERVEWSYALKAPAAAPTLFPDAARPSGVVIAAGRDVIRLDGRGQAVWTATQPTTVGTPATVADLNGDAGAEIVFGLSSGQIVCLNADGAVRWRSAMDAPPWEGFEMLTAADVLPEPGLEILAGCEDGWLCCLNAQGELRWRFHGDRFRTGPVAVGDVNGDGAPELVYGTDNGHVYCLTGWGTVKWRYGEIAPYGRSGPNLADLDGDGTVEVLITRSNVGIATCLMALDGATGAFRWRTQDVMQGYVSNAVVDLDGDGKLETLHADKGNHLYCTTSEGRHRWRVDLAGRGIFWAPAVGDVDGDGHLETVVGVRGTDPETGACAYLVGCDGTIDGRLKLGGGANASPAMGDIDGDGKLEVILVTQSPDQVLALGWGKPGRVAWPSMRGDSAMRAATRVPAGRPVGAAIPDPTGEVTIETGVVAWGRNVWTLSWREGVGEDAFVEFSVAAPTGIRETQIVDLNPNATKAEVTWNLAQSGEVVVTVRLIDPKRGTRFIARRTVKPKGPAFCNLVEVQKACDSASKVAETRGQSADGLHARLVALWAARDAVQKLAESAPDKARLAQAATRLRDRARSLHATATALTAFWNQGGAGDFVIWQDANPWDRFDPAGVPAELSVSATVKLAAYGDEFEDVALSLLNVTAQPIDVRCTFVEPTLTNKRAGRAPELAGHITLRRAIRTPSRLGGMRNDALPVLDRSGVITLAPGEARQVWVVADTHGLKAGTHRITLHLGTLSITPTFRALPIEIEVWPVRLPKVYAQMNWARVDAGRIPDQMVRDMLDHGVSVFYGPSASVSVNAEGKQAGPVDWQQFDATLKRLPDYAQVLFSAPPTRRWPEGSAPKAWDDRWVAGFSTAVLVLAEHMNAVGWGYDRWAFYPIDEPWLTGDTHLPHLRRFCQAVKSADPKARNYADPAGLVRVEGVSKFVDLIDVWQPEMNLLKRDPKLVAWFRRNARAFWSYEAPGPSRDLLPLGHYRGFAWLAWKYGTQGAGYWVYRDLDLWWPVQAGDYGAVYPAGDEVVASRRWEASRDGVEDYRAFHMLSREIAECRKAGLADPADRAERLMADAVEAVVGRQSRTIDEITRMTRDYEIDLDVLSNARLKIAREIIALRKARQAAR